MKMKSAIEKITLNDATFYEEEISPSFINFIYGKNGTGKSTIVKTIRNDTNIQWQCGKSSNDYDVLVYDTNFINDNFKNYENLPGVFTICEENISIQNLIELKNKNKNLIEQNYRECVAILNAKKENVNAVSSSFRTDIWGKTKKLRTRFDFAIVGKKKTSQFANEILSTEPVGHTYSDLEKLYDVAFSANAKTYSLFSKAGKVTYGTLHGKDLLGESVTSSSNTLFASFIKAMNATDWVRHGHFQFEHHANGKCPFCQQKLPADFENEIAACFDSQYSDNINAISLFRRTYSSEMKNILQTFNKNLDTTIISPDLAEYKTKLKTLTDKVTINLQRIELKVKEPATVVTLEDTDSLLIEIGLLIDSINSQIKMNNDIVNDIKIKKDKCKKEVWEYLAYVLRDDVTRYKTSIESLDEEIKTLCAEASSLKAQIKTLTSELADLNKKTVNTLSVIENMNTVLRDSGFHGFTLRAKSDIKNTYEIVRPDGSIANNLSEGERHFITFLYFYHLVFGSRSSKEFKEKIVVIDDPVSGMDDNTLFIVSTLVRKIIEACRQDFEQSKQKSHCSQIKQIFVLTHNTYLQKEITCNQLLHYSSVSFFVIKKFDNVSHIKKCVRQNANALDKFENYNPVKSSYAAMWDELKELNSPICVLNVIRRILEYYLIQTCGYTESDVQKIVLDDNRERFVTKSQDGKNDYTKYYLATYMLSYVGSQSSADNISDCVDDYKDVTQHMTVLRLIFESLHQERHYNMMMGQSAEKS